MQRRPNRRFSLRTMDVLHKVLPEKLYYRYVGRHEQGSMRLWSHLVTRLGPGTAVLDVGAYHGLYALATRELRADLDIHAFEPNPVELEALRAACAGRDISVVPSAVTDHCGFVSFTTSGETSHIVGGDHKEALSVEAVALDQWNNGADLDVSLMKVDVEGGEDAVFRGASRLMERARPLVLCEVLTEAAGRRVAGSLPKDYAFFEINEDRGAFEGPIPTRKNYRHKNWLLVPEERRSEIPVGRWSR